MSSTAEPHAGGHLTGYWKRRTASLFRWLHIYLSMVSFGILFFFAVTGLTLNHGEWFLSDHDTTTHTTGTIKTEWLAAQGPLGVAKLEVVEHLRSQHGV